MKRSSRIKIIGVVIFVFMVQLIHAQCINTCGANLLPNPDFETSTSFCSTGDIQLYTNQSPVQSWFGTEAFVSGSSAGSTPDYFSPCAGSTNSANSVCISGAARVGFFTRTSFANGREYVQAQLNSSLIAGKTYCFSMVVKSKVGAAGNPLSNCDGVGAWFHNQGLINIATMNGGTQFIGAGTTINAVPQIDNTPGNLISGTCYTVTGTFCADGGESNIVIGNFRNDANTQMTGSATSNYMYVDNVSLFEVCSTPLNVVLAASPQSVCPGSCSQLSATATGGSGTYTYQWLPGGATTNTISVCPLATTTYTLITTSASPCATPVTTTETITVNVSALSLGINIPPAICNGSSATLIATPSVPGGNFLWSPGGETTASITVNPSAGTNYSCTYTNAGCSANATASVTVNQPPVAVVNSATVCAGASATLTASGGTIYLWSTGETNAAINVAPAVTTVYTVTVTDNGCSASETATLTVNNCTSTSPCTNTCGANLIANGGFENSTVFCTPADIQLYNNQSPVQGWFGTEGFDPNVMAGSTPDYFSSCAGTTNAANSTCITGGARVGLFTRTSFTNGREYVQSQLNTALVAGKTYCFSMVVKSRVGAAGNPLSSCDGIGAWFHNQGVIDINTMNGGAQFIGAGSAINAMPQVENLPGNLISGTCYTVTGTFCAQGGENNIVIGNFRNDANTQMTGSATNNYMYIDDVSLFEICSTPLNVVVAAGPPPICEGSCATVSASATGGSGSYTYLWQPGGATTNTVSVCPSLTTTYTLTVTSQTPCGTQETIVDSVAVTVADCFSGVTANAITICSGSCGSVSASAIGASGSIIYSWQPGSLTGNTISVCPNVTTVYTVTATNASGLNFTDTCSVFVLQTPVANAGVDDTICLGNSVTLNGTGGGTYSWNTSPVQTSQSITVNPSVTTSYVLTSANGICTSTDSVTVSPVQPPLIQIQKNDISCFGLNNGSATATISGGMQPVFFSWNPGGTNANTIANLAAGSYTFSVTDAVGCNYSETIDIVQPDALSLQINGATLICAGTSTNLAAQVSGGNAGYLYNWHGAGPDQAMITVTPAVSTNYSLTVVDPQGCQSVSSHQINVASPPQAFFEGTDTLCVPFNTTFVNQSLNAIQYTWQFGDGSTSSFENPTHSYTSPGIYSVSLIAESGNGCADTFSIQHAIYAVQPPMNNIQPLDNTVSEFDPLIYFNFESADAVSCVVNFGDGITTNLCQGNYYLHAYKDTGTYCASITSVNTIGCSYTSTTCVYIYPEFTFYVPDAFTPDNDGINDSFTGYGSNFKDFEMSIYNRWGELIYQSNDYEKPWDGKVQGKTTVSQIDAYIYKISVTDMNGTKQLFTGQVKLIR